MNLAAYVLSEAASGLTAWFAVSGKHKHTTCIQGSVTEGHPDCNMNGSAC